MYKETGAVWKLGMFVLIGVVLLVASIYFIGKQKNLFGATFQLKSIFKNVSGLKVGNNVLFSGINVGTVSGIALINDSSVVVTFIIQQGFKRFIKKDCHTSIGSDGLMGDKVLDISSGTHSFREVNENDSLLSQRTIEIDDIMQSAKNSTDKMGDITTQIAEFSYKLNHGNGLLQRVISDEVFSNSMKNTLVHLDASSAEFAKFTVKMNNGKGLLHKLVSDETLSKTLDTTLTNLKESSKGLNENMEAAQHNILLRGYFNNKKKQEKKQQDLLKKKMAKPTLHS